MPPAAPPNLSELAASMGTRVVRVRGREIVLRAVSAAQDAAVRRVLPRPEPPMRPDLQRGTLSAVRVPDWNDADYVRARAAWRPLYTMALLAVSMGALARVGDSSEAFDHGQGLETLRAWVEAAVRMIGEAFTAGELLLLEEELAACDGAEEIEGRLGNSSGGPSPHPTAASSPPATA